MSNDDAMERDASGSQPYWRAVPTEPPVASRTFQRNVRRRPYFIATYRDSISSIFTSTASQSFPR